MAIKPAVARYHPLLVALHWVVALLILGNLLAGSLLLAPLADSDPAKLGVLRLHMIGGIAILGLMVLRIATRLRTRKPPPAKGGIWAHRLARANHWALYLAIFAMTSTGLGMAQLGGFFPLIGGAPVTLPDLKALPPHAGHELFANVIIGLIALHLAGTLYHLLKEREPIVRRMWFGRRTD